MDGTGDAESAIAMDVGTIRAAMILPLGNLGAGRLAIQLLWWGGACLASVAAAYVLVRWWRSVGGRSLLLSLPIQRWPDFRKWDERGEFELHEAAALWFNAEPRVPMWWRARWKCCQWRSVIAAGAFPGEPRALDATSAIQIQTTSSGIPYIRVRRETLKILAEREGTRPLFLFPESRG